MRAWKKKTTNKTKENRRQIKVVSKRKTFKLFTFNTKITFFF